MQSTIGGSGVLDIFRVFWMCSYDNTNILGFPTHCNFCNLEKSIGLGSHPGASRIIVAAEHWHLLLSMALELRLLDQQCGQNLNAIPIWRTDQELSDNWMETFKVLSLGPMDPQCQPGLVGGTIELN